MKKTLFAVGVLLAALLLSVPARADVMLGQVQTFDAPSDPWVFGAGPVLMNPTPFDVVLGGPGGAADPYLEVVAVGGAGGMAPEPLSRLAAQNFGDWAGDYIAAGVTRITMDVKNFGPDDLFLRFLFVEFAGPAPVSAALTTAPAFVPAGGDWQTVSFRIKPSSLTSLFGDPEVTLANAGELRLYHEPTLGFPPSTVEAVLGVDNITATVPEPAVLTLLSGALAAVLARRRKSVRRSSLLH